MAARTAAESEPVKRATTAGGARWAFLTALLPVAALAQDVEGALGAWAGGGYESNLARAAATEAPGGDWAAELGALGGVAWGTQSLLLGAGATYRGRVFATATELTSHALGGNLLGAWAPLDSLQLGLSPSGAYVAQGDPARNGYRVDGRPFVRLVPLDWLRVRAGYGYLLREAVDPTFSSRTHEAAAAVSVRPLEWLDVSAGYTLVAGPDVVYREDATAAAGGTGGRRQPGPAFTTAGGTTLYAVQVTSLQHVGWAGAEVTLPLGFFVGLDGAVTRGTSELGGWTSYSAALQAGWDWE